MSGIINDYFYNFFSGNDLSYWVVIAILVFIIIFYLLKPSRKDKK